ncbi:MAG: TetR/AcrR family transcriptional regulator [Rectinemataceae bacterium]
MGSVERKIEEQDQRRNRMLDAAEKLFAVQGIEGTSMDAVAAEAGFTKRTVYQYFASKEALVAELTFRGQTLLNLLTEEFLARAGTGLARAKACGEAFFAFQRDHGPLFAIMQRARSMDSSAAPAEVVSRIARAGDRNFSFLQSAIEDGIRDGSVRSDLAPFPTALLVMSLSVGLVETVKRIDAFKPGGFPLERESFLSGALEFLGAALSSTPFEPAKKKHKERT